MWLDTKERTGRTQGYMLAEDGASALYGDSGDFDFARQTGRLYGAHAGHGDWRVHARQLDLNTGRKTVYRGARFTSCSFDPEPHYHFRASKLSVTPKKHMVAYNTVFYLGPVPLFYTPVLYKSLAPTHTLRWRLQPGYDRRNGGFVKGTLTTSHGPYAYSKLFADYYWNQGFGAGGELHRRKGEDSRGGLFGYRIKESNGSGEERWAMVGDAFQALPSSFSLQGRLQVQSDADFNNHYARSSAFRVTPELINSAALTHRTSLLVTRLSYSRRDLATASRTLYEKETESYPRLDVQTTPFKLWRLPWLNSVTAFADNNYQRFRPYLERSAGAEWEITRTIPVMRSVSWQPKLAYGQTYLNRFERPVASTETVLDAFVGRYRFENTVRAGLLDVSHFYKQRFQPDSLSVDSAALDHGVEQNLVAAQQTFRPHRKTLVRFQQGYDFRVFRDREVGFRTRVQPFVGEIYYTPTPLLNVTLRDEYKLEDGNTALIADARWGEDDGNMLGGGLSYNAFQPDQYVGSAEFAVANSSKTLRVGGALRSVVSSQGGFDDLHGFRLFEKELFITRTFHDFHMKVLGRIRPGNVKEIQFRLDIKLPAFSKEQKEREKQRDWEAEFFPDRDRRKHQDERY